MARRKLHLKRTVQAKVTIPVLRQLEAIADGTGQSVSSVVRGLIVDFVARAA